MADKFLYELAERAGHALQARGVMIATAESCTGGWIAKTLTDISGSSAWFECGLAAYSYEAKQALLGVRPETLEHHGAVSRETVIEMVSGALVHSGATLAVAVTGIAGPGGGTEDKPVGTVCWCAKRGDGSKLARDVRMPGDRAEIRDRSTTVGMHLLRRLLRGEEAV